MSSTYETVKVEHENGIAWVILNRPDKRNAMSPQLHYDMCEVLDELAKGAPIRIVAGSATGNADFWIVKAESPVKNIKDASRAHTIAYSSNGSSTALAAARRCRSRSRESVIAAGVDHAPPSPGAEAWMARAWTPF
jgi:1,4-dihydroxy-2-naphthoyl-CoA synthase